MLQVNSIILQCSIFGMVLQNYLTPLLQPADQSCSIQAFFTGKAIFYTHLPVDSMLKSQTYFISFVTPHPPFTEAFSLSTKRCSSFIDIINTAVVWRNFTCEESLSARGSSEICLQTGRNKKLKTRHRCVFTSYALGVSYSFMGAAGTVSAKTDCWCYPWAQAEDFEQATQGPGTEPEEKGDIDTYWQQ